MKGLRIKYFIFSILAMLSIVSVGFASWVTTEDVFSTTVDGTIKVDDIANSDDYINCSKISVFEFFKTGFVQEDGSITTEGSINIPIIINLTNCKNKFKNNEDLLIELDMFYTNFRLLYYTTNGPMSLDITYNNTSVEFWYNDYSCISKFQINNISNYTEETIQINVKYAFTINDVNYYSKNIYPTLINDYNNDKLIFKFSAKIAGVNNEN